METVVTKDISASQEQVFTVFSDLRNAGRRISGINKLEVLTTGPVGVGTRWRETRTMFGKEATEEMEITAFEPPHSYRVEAHSHGAHYISDFTFTPIDDGEATRVAMRFQGIPQTVMARIMALLMGKMMKGAVDKCMSADMEDLKKTVEGSEA